MTAFQKDPGQGVLTPIGEKPLVSIVMVSYNQGDYIEETIVSILGQDYEPLELIIVDGDSTDNTLEILKKYDDDPRVKLVSEPDNSTVHAYNKGLRRAKGVLVGLQNSSDTYEMGIVSRAVKEYSNDPFLAIVFGSVREMDVSGVPLAPAWTTNGQRTYVTTDAIASLQQGPPFMASFFRPDLALSIGGFDEDVFTNSEYFFFRYMLEATRTGGRSLLVNEHWANFRRHPNSLSDKISLNDGLLQVVERRVVCQRFAEQFQDLLSREQARSILRLGYLGEFTYRAARLKQVLPALPSFWGFIKNRGLYQLSLGKMVHYFFAFFQAHILRSLRRSNV